MQITESFSLFANILQEIQKLIENEKKRSIRQFQKTFYDSLNHKLTSCNLYEFLNENEYYRRRIECEINGFHYKDQNS